MRTIDEIKDGIAADFMNREEIAEIYGFAPGDDFYKHFSKVSFINILFYVFAAATWVIEKFHEDYREELRARIEQIIPHRAKWYRDMAMRFIPDKALLPDSDQYDLSGMSDEDIESARPVKAAVAIESDNQSLLYIKVKGADKELDKELVGLLEGYMNEIKDAGVKLKVISQPGDLFTCELKIFYTATMYMETVEEACREAVKNYLENLPFNGEYSNMGLVDALKKVEGVRVAEVSNAQYAPDKMQYMGIGLTCVPDAGWFRVDESGIGMELYTYDYE